MASIEQVKSTIKKLISHDFGKSAPPSILVMGSPGIGKTFMTESLAEELGARYKVWLTATMDPTDIAGCPQPTGNITRFLPPEDLYSLTIESGNTEPVIACFDDLPAANDQVFASLFRLFQQREVGGFKLRDNVLIIATGNRVEDKSAARELPLALANRCIRFDIDQVKTEEWLNWALVNGVTPEVYGFISSAPDQLNKFNPDNVETSFPTPRSVTMASKIQQAMGLEDPNLFLALQGACGAAWAISFKAYLKNHALLISPKEIFADPVNARIPTGEQIDITFATISALVYEVNKSRKITDARAAVIYANRFPHKEHTTQVCRIIVTEIGAREKQAVVLKVTQDPEIREIFNASKDYLSIPYKL
jgi:hypothetical protein